MALQWDAKDPQEVDKFQLDWTRRLDTGETISTSSWAISCDDEESPTLTEDSNGISSPYTTIWLSSGTLGLIYELTNTVETSEGKTLEQTVRLKIKSK